MAIDVQELVFLLAARLDKRKDDLAVISSMGYSFEGWVKWEEGLSWA